MVYISLFFYFTYIANSKTWVGFRIIFRLEKGSTDENRRSPLLQFLRFFYQDTYLHFSKYRNCTLNEVITS